VLKRMMITRGPYKGYEGIVKEATDAVARIELQSKMKIVTVNVSELKDLDTDAGAMRNATMGGIGDMRPPATPAYAPNTPSHDSGILNTPSRDGTMTPGRWDDAWNPEAGNRDQVGTPGGQGSGFTPSDYGGSEANSPMGAQAYSPYTGSMGMVGGDRGTPGLRGPITPGADTPGEEHGRPVGTPGVDPNNPGTPSAYTPGGYQGTPAMYGQAPTPTPGSGTPGMVGSTGAVTPGADVPTPGGWGENDGGGNDMTSWLSHAEQVEVEITSGTYASRTGVVKGNANPSDAAVRVDVDGEEVQIEVIYIQRKVPGKKDRIKVVSGALAGETGVLIGIDGDDGIVKMDTNSDIKILELALLATLAAS